MGIKISDLPDAAPLDGSEYIVFVQGGVTVKKRVVALFAQPVYIKASGNEDPGFQDGDLTISIAASSGEGNKATLEISGVSDTINE